MAKRTMTVWGEIDTADEVAALFARSNGARAIVLDCSDLVAASADAVEAIGLVQRAYARSGGDVVVIGVSAHLGRLFDLFDVEWVPADMPDSR